MQTRVITVAQQKGGSGKSTVAAHLAVYFARQGHSAALLDIDPQGTLAFWHGVREESGIPEGDIAFSAVSGWRVQSELRAVRHKYDVIIVDSSPHAQTETRTAIREADLVLIPAQPSPADLWATQAALDIAEKEKSPAVIVLNRVPPKANLTETVRERFPADLLLTETLGNRVAYAAAMMEGKTVFEKAPASSSAAKEIAALCEAVAEKAGVSPQAKGKKSA